LSIFRACGGSLPLFEEANWENCNGSQVRDQQGQSDKFRFHLESANGEIIAASQGYETKASAEKGIESVKTSAPAAKVVDPTEREPAHN
jgi:uncharacterized protein YegP (UPF0339 family)